MISNLLTNKTVWVVGGVGVVGRGITKSFLEAGATVIVNSRSETRLHRVAESLEYPENLIAIQGSLLPGRAEKTVSKVLETRPLDHVVAHGAARLSFSEAGGDESHSVLSSNESFLQMNPEDFTIHSSQLASLHFSAAQALIPRIQWSNGQSSYTFVTSDGRGHPNGKQSALGELNSHHIWGLAAALRADPKALRNVSCREIRVQLQVNRPSEERQKDPRNRPLSEDIGRLCAGIAAYTGEGAVSENDLLEIDDQSELDSLLREYYTMPLVEEESA